MLNQKLLDLIIPSEVPSLDFFLEKYPPRGVDTDARVVRIAPSPTGSPHFGIVYVATLNEHLARQSKGTFVVRIEDTDEKREVENGIGQLLETLDQFDIHFDEGPVSETDQRGQYGPYIQSQRRQVYLSAVKYLLKNGFAYPCFCTETEIESMRQEQSSQGVTRPGYYGKWAKCRHLTPQQLESKLQSKVPFTIRFRTPDSPRTIQVTDLVKGELTLPGNDLDYVILKTGLGLPVYHLAAMVDDHLQRINLVLRGDEWLASLPFHLQIIDAFGWKPPEFGHFATIMKQEGNGKRKLSKRKDPEAAASFYVQQGFPAQSVKAYVLRLANSSFEDWRRDHPLSPLSQFPFTFEHMSQAGGALFDMVKLTDISKEEIAQMPASEIFKLASHWAAKHNPVFYELFTADPDYSTAILNIERTGDKVRKDLYKWSQLPEMISYFYDQEYAGLSLTPVSEHVTTPSLVSQLLRAYLASPIPLDNRENWTAHLRFACQSLGFAQGIKDYKSNPAAFPGHIGDITMILRLSLTGRTYTPDLFELMTVMGKDRVASRLSQFILAS